MSKAKVSIDIGSKFDAKGFKKAETALGKMNKSIKSLAGGFGLAYGMRAITQFSSQAIKAFAEDQAAATKLAKVLDNLGLSFANPAINKMIDSMTLATGVADTELRSAFQALITTTGSLTNSQSLLNDAINISRGSGLDLATVSQDLANAYVGNTRGLKKYNLGLTQAELKTASFAQIQKKLNDQFKGSSAVYLKTYAGQMQVLSNSASEAKEVIGKGLVDALVILSGNTTVGGLSDDMQTAATNSAKLLTNLAKITKALSTPFVATGGALAWFIEKTQPLADLVFAGDPTGFMKKPRATARRFYTGGSKPANTIAANKAELAAAKRAKELAALLKTQAKTLKDQTTLKKASAIFDLTQVQIIAALKGNISAEERKRLELQLALATDNTAEAQKLTYELAKSQGLTESLARTLASLPDAKNPFESWAAFLDRIEAQAKRIAGQTYNGTVITPSQMLQDPSAYAPTVLADALAAEAKSLDILKTLGIDGGSSTPAETTRRVYNPYDQSFSNQPIVVQIDGKTIATALQDQSLSGVNSTVNRSLGGFGM